MITLMMAFWTTLAMVRELAEAAWAALCEVRFPPRWGGR